MKDKTDIMKKTDRTDSSPGSMSRRDFMKIAGGAALVAGSGFLAGNSFAGAVKATAPTEPVNILLIITDQQHFDTIAAGGCPYVTTPAFDKIKTSGLSFKMSYTTNPVCSPARSSIFTGRMPSETGVYKNQLSIRADIPNLDQWFSQETNYETIYSGKWHTPSSYQRNIDGFTVINTGIGGQGNLCDTNTSRACEGFLWNRTNTEPFLMVAALLQPHDICEWLRLNTYVPAELRYPELAGQLPALPDNFNFDPNEPAAVINRRASTDPAKGGGWSEEHWRYYRYCYYRHIEMVDAEIGRILQALEDTGHAQDTLIVFTSEHGEGMGHHQWVRKSCLYEETANIPLIFSLPGHILENQVDTTHLVSGIDIMPTLCDYAGIAPPPGGLGKSLKPLLEGTPVPWRAFLVSEVKSNTGRMVRTERYKYITYVDDPVEQLFDMQTDPGETVNLAADPQHASTLSAHKEMLRAWETQMDVAPDLPNADAWWRKGCDFTGEGLVNGTDLRELAQFWLAGPNLIEKYDFNNDNIVNYADFTTFSKHWKEQIE